ncbi:MAG: ATPase, T2SS/T4P/T4SS family [Candidatus Kariarchaeaceae archaeon]
MSSILQPNIDKGILPQYEAKYTNIIKNSKNLEADILSLQNEYLEIRKLTKGPPLVIDQKLVQLESIAISNILETHDINLAKLLAWSAINLREFYLIFLDSEVIEAFGSHIGERITITHRTLGRCVSNQVFSYDFWLSLKLQVELNSRSILSPINPTLKTGLQTGLGNFRISLQIPPRTPSSPAFSIRRIPVNPISIDELMLQKQINKQFAEILIRAVENRKNIIIAGEPGSGKTTLANALLLACHPSWRLILIEDASEVNVPLSKLPMAIRYSLPTIGDTTQITRKNEISKLLHRSPDYVFLGEIQNEQDTKIVFESFASGIRGIATTHARDISGLLSRWKDSHKLNSDLINSLDFIVITHKKFCDGIFELGTSNLYRMRDGTLEGI